MSAYAAAKFRFRKWRNLERPLSLLAALVLVCAAIVGLDGWRTLEARRDAIQADYEETANLARSLAQHAHDTFFLVDTILLGLREWIEVDGLAEDRLERLRNVMRLRLTQSPSLHGLFVYDRQGNWIVSTNTDAPAGLNNSDHAYFRHHQQQAERDVFVGAPVRSNPDGAWVVTVSRRLEDAQGQFAGVVLATIPVSYLAAFYKTFDVGRSGILTLTMANGTLIARNPHDPNMTGRDVSRSEIFTRFLPRAAVGSFQYSSVIDGVVRLGSYRRVAGFPLVIVVGHGLDEVLSEWRSTAALHTAVSLAMAAGLGVIAWKFMRQSERTQRAQRHYRLLADNSSDAIMCVGLDGRRLYVSPAFTTLTGWSQEEVMQRRWGDLVHPDDQESSRDMKARLLAGETDLSSTYRYLCKSGDIRWVEARLHLAPATGDEETQYVINIRDISERKRIEDQLAAMNEDLAVQARTDVLTGLANRRRFDEALRDEWRRGARDEVPLSILMIDVDRFKLFNDAYGHGAGDVCLARVAAAVAGCVRRPGDLVARYGGEEISVVLPNTSRSGARELAEAIRAAVQDLRIAHDDNRPSGVVTVSIGAATRVPQVAADKDAAGLLELTALADAALYQSKNAGRNRVSGEDDLPDSSLPPCLADEPERLAALASYRLDEAQAPLDSLNRIARLTSVLFRVPTAMVSLVGSERQCFVGRFGIDASGTPRDISFCAHAITGEGVFTVADAKLDHRFVNNPLVTGEPHIRFYAGAPLVGIDGHHLGALCVIDQKSRPPLSREEKALLKDLADLAVSYLDQQRLLGAGLSAA